LKILFFVFSLLGLGAAVAFSFHVQGMACAFVTNSASRGCPFDWPWQMSGEDFVLLGLPQILFALLLAYSAFLLIK